MSPETRLFDLLRRWDAARNEGKFLSVEELCADCPELADALRARVRMLCDLDPFLGAKAAADEQAMAADGMPDDVKNFCSRLGPPDVPGEIGTLGRYRIIRRLGAGGMGIVFEAFDQTLQRPVAFKIMRRDDSSQASIRRKRFLREARAAAKLNGEHIAEIYDFNESGGVPYIVMQLLRGEPLDRRLERAGRLSVAEVLRIGRETARGLAVAHDRDLIHRDIKPANLWLEESPPGRVKILDFGLARTIAGPDAPLTATGYVVGTRGYMAPEQANGEHFDHKADLFSLGVVMYRMATGCHPQMGWAGEGPRSPSELDPSIPRAMSDLILRLLARRPAERPATAANVAETLADIESSLTATTGDAFPTPPPAAPGHLRIRLNNVPPSPAQPRTPPTRVQSAWIAARRRASSARLHRPGRLVSVGRAVIVLLVIACVVVRLNNDAIRARAEKVAIMVQDWLWPSPPPVTPSLPRNFHVPRVVVTRLERLALGRWLKPGEKFTVRVGLRNRGTAPLPPHDIVVEAVKRRSLGSPPAGRTFKRSFETACGRVHVPELLAGEAQQYDVECLAPAKGDYSLILTFGDHVNEDFARDVPAGLSLHVE